MATRIDCEKGIARLVAAINSAGWECDLIVFGSYYKEWKDGLSDLDAMLYLSKFPTSPESISIFHREIKNMYAESSVFLEDGFFGDVFVLDSLHGQDGRFMMFDSNFLDNFINYATYKVVAGKNFLGDLNPVQFRNQDELELANGLHKLRNYLLFEIPKSPDLMSMNYAKTVLKYFKVLPRVVTFIARNHMAHGPEDLSLMFPSIDYYPLHHLWNAVSTPSGLKSFLESWHEDGFDVFMECLNCYEETLVEVVKNLPMRSRF